MCSFLILDYTQKTLFCKPLLHTASSLAIPFLVTKLLSTYRKTFLISTMLKLYHAIADQDLVQVCIRLELS
uniref:Uncharacterized protein n=1 Tax=Physcomitrium patens TaxID=3218 RepID=A0A2K1ICE6_PHYPA|nr:hypothetical protein PHYPA_030436 [Physcomitrium patens]